MSDLRADLIADLAAFGSQPLPAAARAFFKTLGYQSDRTIPVGSVDAFCRQFDSEGRLAHPSALRDQWKSVHLVFQLTNEELSAHTGPFQDSTVKPGLLQSYLFFAIELTGKDYARGKLTAIARQINRVFPMPVMLLIRHGDSTGAPVLSIAVINRRQNKLHPDRDILEKVTLIRDIALTAPHRGHLDILASFAVPNLVHPQRLLINNFDALHTAWEQIFNIDLLNERFYRELANWYFWALPQVDFPADLEPDSEKRRATGLIRLLTRLIFCWFLKEKGLIPDKLFHPTDLEKLLKDLSPESSSYYHAILQNLFFATLNQRMGKDGNGKPYRVFAKDEGFLKNRAAYDINNLYRYESLFREPAEIALGHFADIPFLNGGLFECLDRTEDGTNKKRYLDGFSRNAKKRPTVPNRLFFGAEETVNLADIYGDTKRKAEKVSGLISILNRYKFTIVENTPIDQEIALDPELLGKVFENLLASYNEETKTTARKQTGSFYTPRPIVDYMVDESLKAHLTRTLVEKGRMQEPDARAGLDLLFAYTEKSHAFTASEVACLIAAIDALKILDPACGSGAFPMGVLHKLVYTLGKLDPDNNRWKQTQLAKLDSTPMREELERAFADNNDDYGRKLYLIENCLYGVDIQPVAIQITKLRFFISLVCDQKTSRNKKENHGIRPLPNLETKFVAADTLIDMPEMEQTLLVDPRVGLIEKEIESLYHNHFSIQRRDQKLALQRKIKALRNELADILAESLMSPAKSKHIAEWDPFDPQSSADFFDPHWMYGRSLAAGFDVVIGNPPYVGFRDMNKLVKDRIKNRFVSTQGKFDLYVPFVERGINILRNDGVLSFIMPSSFAKRDYGEALRKFILGSCSIEQFVDFGHSQIFSAATNYTGILQIRRQHSPPEHQFSYRYGNLDSEITHIPQSRLSEYPWILLAPFEQRILEKILSSGRPLSSFASISEGVVTGLNDLYLVDASNIATKSPIFKPCLRGREIRRYCHVKPLEYLFYPYVDSYGKAEIIAESDLRTLSPEFMGQLEKQKDLIYSRGYFSKSNKAWYELWNQRRTDNFESIKVVTPELAEGSRFAIADSGMYYGDTVCGIIPKADARISVRSLVAILNSSVVQWYYKKATVPKANGFFIYKVMFLKDVPIPLPSEGQAEVFEVLVGLMELALTDPGAESAAIGPFLEDLIDACVMECYFYDHMAKRDLLFHDTLALHLITHNPEASEVEQRDFLSHLYQTLNASKHPIRNRLFRLSADSPDLLAPIREEGRV